MKKLIALILSLLLIPCWAMACEDTPMIPKNENGNLVFSGASWWPITNDCRPAGIMAVDEPTEFLPTQTAPGQWVAGKLPSGWAKYTAAIKTVNLGCTIAGLTRLDNAPITLFPQYEGIAQAVIASHFGDGVEISANAIAACATWWQGDYASTIYFTSYSDGVQAGWVCFNGTDLTPLMLGHFGGELHFGLKTSEEIAPEVLAAQAAAAAQAQAEAEAAAQAQASAHASAQATAAAAVSVSNSGSIDNSGNGCYRNNTIVQINILSVIWQGIKNITNQSCAE